MSRKNLIVGIDPGTTAGVALINLSGKLIDVKSGKNLGKRELTEYIISRGSPVLISTDKKTIPSSVEKIANSFDSRIFSPEKDLTQEEKNQLVEEYEVDDSHQVDALASAIYAFNSNSDKIEKINSTMSKLNLPDHTEEVKAMILRGKAKNITNAIENILHKEEEVEDEEEEERHVEREDISKEKIENLKKELSQTKSAVKTLKEYSEKLKEEVKDLKGEKEEIEREKEEIKQGKKDEVMKMDEVKRLGKTTQSLRRGLRKEKREKKEIKKKLEKFRLIENKRKQGLIPIYIAKKFNRNEIERIKKEFGLNRSIIMFQTIVSPNLSLVDILKENKVRAVIGDFDEEIKENLLEKDISIIDKNEIDLEIHNNLGFISPEDFESGKKAGKEGFLKWLRHYRKRF